MSNLPQILLGLKAAAEPTRLRIMALCQESSLTVSDFTQILRQSQPNLSRHLKLLVAAGLLERSREGSFAYYSIARQGDGAELAAMLTRLCPKDDPILQRDGLQLDQIKKIRAARASNYFRDHADSWEEIRGIYSNNNAIEQKIIELVQGILPSLPRLDQNGQFIPQKLGLHLDLGTGGGRLLEILAPYCQHQIGIDQSREMLAVARAKLDHPPYRHISLRQADLYNVPLEDGSVNLITLFHVLHYVDEPLRALREAARLLAPMGSLLLADFIAHERQELREEHSHIWLGFSELEIMTLCQTAGLRPPRQYLLPATDANGLTAAIWQTGTA